MPRKHKSHEIDQTDLDIISILTFDAKTPYAEIAVGEEADPAWMGVHARNQGE